MPTAIRCVRQQVSLPARCKPNQFKKVTLLCKSPNSYHFDMFDVCFFSSKVQSPTSSSQLVKYKAMYTYEATREDELTIREGDLIQVMRFHFSFCLTIVLQMAIFATKTTTTTKRSIIRSKRTKDGYGASAKVAQVSSRAHLLPNSAISSY